MARSRSLLAALALTALAAPPVASADTLLAPAPGARHLAAAGGWYAWAGPQGDGTWRITTLHDGVVATPPIRSFRVAPDLAVGSNGFAVDTKTTVVVYPRCAANSTVRGCDLYELDLETNRERKLTNLSTASGSEYAPSVSVGRVGFARRGGPKPGTYTGSLRGTKVRRLDGRVARETSVSISRIAYYVRTTDGRDEITMSQLDGARRRLVQRAPKGTLFNPVITRYRVGWLERGTGTVVAKMTDRVNPSDTVITGRPGRRALPASTVAAATDDSRIAYYLDAAGVQRAVPPLFN